MARTSKIILAKGIKVDKDYLNITNISESNWLNIIVQHSVANANDCSFVHAEGKDYIAVPFAYSVCLSANYIAFQNPDYSNKWFFGFIDKVEFGGSGGTQKIYFTIDIMATWWDYWWYKKCLVEREHVASDNIGEHIMDENLDTGDYVVNKTKRHELGNMWFCVCTSQGFSRGGPDGYQIDSTKTEGGIYNGIYSSCYYYITRSGTQLRNMIRTLASNNKIDTINGVFVIPSLLIPPEPYSVIIWGSGDSTIYEVQEGFDPIEIFGTDFVLNNTIGNGYVPKNKKLLSYPYSYILIDNGGAQNTIVKREFLPDKSKIDYTIKSVVCPGMSCRLQFNYKGLSLNFNEGINLAKFPICNFPVDMYVVWNSQNLANIIAEDTQSYSTIAGATTFGLGALSVALNPESLASAVETITDSFTSNIQHSHAPTISKGNVNNGDVIASSKDITFHFYQMTITEEFARSLDGFFDKFGYKVMQLKLPEFVSRPHWNYVKICSGEQIGDSTGHNNIEVPSQVMDRIDKIFQRGTTIWHNHDEIGDYSLDNSIQ